MIFAEVSGVCVGRIGIRLDCLDDLKPLGGEKPSGHPATTGEQVHESMAHQRHGIGQAGGYAPDACSDAAHAASTPPGGRD